MSDNTAILENNTSTKNKKFQRLGFSSEETKAVTDDLNILLANMHVHYQKLRNYHWNVKGPEFFDYHEQFERIYNEVKLQIDRVAERIRCFGETPISTLKEYLILSTIEETGTDLKAEQMGKEIVNDFEILLGFMVTAAETASERGDLSSLRMMQEFMEKIETNHWMLTSFLNK